MNGEPFGCLVPDWAEEALPALCDGPNEASGDAYLFVTQFWRPHKLHLLGAFAKARKVTISFVMSIRPSAWENSAVTGRIFMKFGIWVFFGNCPENPSYFETLLE